MKKGLLLAAVAVATILGTTSAASAACVAPYCPAPTAVTGVASAITPTSAVLTGTVNSNAGGNATWSIILNGPNGPTIVATGAVPDNAGPVGVSGQAVGLAPGTAYSFQVTASGTGGQASGVVIGFVTTASAPSGGGNGGGGGVPSTSEKATPAVSISADPEHKTKTPFKYAISGRLTGVTDDAQCSGKVTVKFSRGKVLKRKTTSVRSDCSYKLSANVPKRKLPKSGNLNVRAVFNGNDSLNANASETIKVGFGPKQ